MVILLINSLHFVIYFNDKCKRWNVAILHINKYTNTHTQNACNKIITLNCCVHFLIKNYSNKYILIYELKLSTSGVWIICLCICVRTVSLHIECMNKKETTYDRCLSSKAEHSCNNTISVLFFFSEQMNELKTSSCKKKMK